MQMLPVFLRAEQGGDLAIVSWEWSKVSAWQISLLVRVPEASATSGK